MYVSSFSSYDYWTDDGRTDIGNQRIRLAIGDPPISYPLGLGFVSGDRVHFSECRHFTENFEVIFVFQNTVCVGLRVSNGPVPNFTSIGVEMWEYSP